MEQFIRIAFWIVTLAGFCLNTQGKPLSKRPIPVEDWNENLFMTVNCTTDTEFYSPENIENECFIEALECITEELNRTKFSNECEDKDGRISQGIDTLYHIMGILNPENSAQQNSSKCNCHFWTEKNFPAFVKDIKTLLQQINEQRLKGLTSSK